MWEGSLAGPGCHPVGHDRGPCDSPSDKLDVVTTEQILSLTPIQVARRIDSWSSMLFADLPLVA